MKQRNVFLICAWGLALILMPAKADADEANRIRPYKQNPRYWQYRGKPVLLLGGTKDDNLFQIPDLAEHLDLLAACGGNYIRNTMSARDPGNVQPFKKLSDGRYDLDRWNPEYWRRLERMLRLTQERDIFPQIELWAFHDFNVKTWPANPWRPSNNINYGTNDTKLNNSAVNLGWNTHEFFFTVPALNKDEKVLAYQKKYVDKILAYSLAYDHVLYCITNEIHPRFSPEWGYYWAGYIKKKAAEKGKAIEITEMLWQTDFRAPQQKESLDRHDAYSYFECSQNSANPGQENGNNMQYVYAYIAKHLRPINHVKIYGADSGPSWAEQTSNAERRFWRNIFGGSASSRFHRPDTGIGLSEKAQSNIRSMRMLTAELNVFRCRPDIGYRLLKDRSEDEAYLIYSKGSQYAVFFPAGGSVKLDLSNVKGSFAMKWLDIANYRWTKSQPIKAGRRVELAAPGKGHWTVMIEAVE
jgi:hypothetical protein